MDNFWIIGGGKFGLTAAKALSHTDASRNLTIVEKDKAVCKRLRALGFEALCRDGIQYLERNLTGAHHPDWIIPAIPEHVAYEWIRTKLLKSHQVERIAVPQDLSAALPNPILAQTGQLFFSIAYFKCPAGCQEPDDICTHTGQPRPVILHELLNSTPFQGVTSVVIRSHQLAPGVGGYPPAALFEALKKIEAGRGPFTLSTACSCHGVIDAFKLMPK